MASYVNLNGTILKEQEANISINNRSFKYGDGCFETMKILNGNIVLSDLHFNRLFSSLEMLQFVKPAFDYESLKRLTLQLTDTNQHSSHARVRLMVFRGEGGPYDEIDNQPRFLIQSWAGSDNSDQVHDEGLVLDIYNDAKKTCDNFSCIKSNNYLPYIMGALHAKKNSLNDCIILNCFNRVAEASIANVFIIKDGVIKTPALTEGCVNGVMRKYLIKCFRKDDLPFAEGEIEVEELLAASEVFLTNALYGIRWIKQVGNSHYTNQKASFLHQKYIAPLFSPATF